MMEFASDALSCVNFVGFNVAGMGAFIVRGLKRKYRFLKRSVLESEVFIEKEKSLPPVLEFSEVFDLRKLQQIQDAFAASTGVASLITDTSGRAITKPSNFSRLCTLIRSTESGLACCMNSDRVVGRPNPTGPNIQPCLSSGLIDAGASIYFGDKHVANWLVGQVIIDEQQKEVILRQAVENGTVSTAFRAALDEVVYMPLDRFTNISRFLFIMANQLSSLAIQGAHQMIEIQERRRAEMALLAEQAKLAKVNATLQAAYESTIEGWALALELRDTESAGHSRRVTKLTMRLAKAIGINNTERVHIRRGALLHDIGKMSIPDSILGKPGALTEDEWQIMKLHPTYAEQMLTPIPFLRPALAIPRCHHEKWDGSGYPEGLRAEAIPLAARIFAVVDVYDALSSDRPYRKAWTHDEVVSYIRSQAGSHFDPLVVEIFCKELVSRRN